MEVKAKKDLEKHLTEGKFYRVTDETDKEYTIINDSKVKYSYPKKAFEMTAETQMKIINETKPHTKVSWSPSGKAIIENTVLPKWVVSETPIPGRTFVQNLKTITSNNSVDDSVNNGGSTDYYKINPEWKDLQDLIEDRKMSYSQANIAKVAFTFNLGRHEGTDELRDINKVIYFAERIKKEILKNKK